MKNQMNCQESGTANLNLLTSNTGPLLPTPSLWLHISRGDLTIMPLIMVMLRFNIHILRLNLTLNLFHIQTPLRLNKSMMMKWTIYCNSSTQNTMIIFWILTYRCFRIDWWYHLLQKFIKYLLCCFINIEEQMLQ